MTTTLTAKAAYYVASGEGHGPGTIERRMATETGIKRILTRERCGGDRWAYAALVADCEGHDHAVDVATIQYHAIGY